MWPKDGYLTFSSIKGRSRSFFTHYLISRIIFFYFFKWRHSIVILQRCRTRTACRNSNGVALGRCRTNTCYSLSCVSQSNFVTYLYWMKECCNRRKCGLDSMFNVCFRQFCPFHKASSKMLFRVATFSANDVPFLTLRLFSNRKPTKRKLIFYLKGWLSIKFYRIIGYPVQLKG